MFPELEPWRFLVTSFSWGRERGERDVGFPLGGGLDAPQVTLTSWRRRVRDDGERPPE